MSSEINKEKVATNFMWRFFERIGAEIVAFVVSIILARLLDPADYGILAIVSVVITIFQVFVDSGLANALIQKKDADDGDFSTVFYFNIAFCLCLYLLLWVISPLFADFYNNVELVPVLRVLGLIIIISGVKNIQQAYVSKHMMFRKFFISTLFGTVLAAIVGITMALKGYGVWALVAQQVVNTLIDTCVLWLTVPWRPKLTFSFRKLKSLFSYGWKLLATGLLGTLYNNISQLCVGKVYSSSDLAYYNKGKSWPNLIMNNINTSIDSVLLPTFSAEQDNKDVLKRHCRLSIVTSTYVMLPLLVGLAIVAEPLTKIILTEKWLESVPYLRIFCLTFLTYPLQTANLNIHKAIGKSDTYLKCEIIKRVIQFILLIISLHISVYTVAVGFAVTNFVGWLIFSLPNRKFISYSFLGQIKDIFPSILVAIIMGLCVYVVGLIPCAPIISLGMQVIIGGLIYILLSYVAKLEGFFYILEILDKFSPRFLKRIIKKIMDKRK